MKNLCIVYNGREGSTAIVDSLDRHSFITVPVVEDMDQGSIEKKFGKNNVSNIAIGVENLILSGAFSDKLFSMRHGDMSPSSKSVVFKWRPFGDMRIIGDVFSRTKTSVLCLARKDLVNFGLSKYYNNNVLGKGRVRQYHPQFEVKRMSEVEREEYINSVRNGEFEVSVPDYLSYLKKYISDKKILFDKIQEVRRRGVEVSYLFYEDFLNSKHEFLNNVLDFIDIDFEDEVLVTDFVKVHNSDIRPQVLNIEDVENDPDVIFLKSEYSALCNKYFYDA